MVTQPLKSGDVPKYFDPSNSAHKQDTDTVHGHMIKLHQHLKDLLMKFLKCKGCESKNLLLKWIGKLMNEHACLFTFNRLIFIDDNRYRVGITKKISVYKLLLLQSS